MKQEFAKEWVDALRSGNYTQGKNRLRLMGKPGQPDQFCCLGVLCDVVKDRVEGAEWTKKYDEESFMFDRSSAFLPISVYKLVGMRSVGGVIASTALFKMNDEGISFNDIADFIEENYEKL